jgi:hypothetical protein
MRRNRQPRYGGLDERLDRPTAAGDLAEFLDRHLSTFGDKYWGVRK